jgi:hypothetical protein
MGSTFSMASGIRGKKTGTYHGASASDITMEIIAFLADRNPPKQELPPLKP